MSLQMAEHWNEHSIPFVLQQFFAPSNNDRSAGCWNFVPDLYKENSTENSCLRLATKAVAKASFSHFACGLPSDNELAQIYARALRATNSTLEHPTERLKDSTTLAVWLLGTFEVLHHPSCLHLRFKFDEITHGLLVYRESEEEFSYANSSRL
jgi:hypothetical protein